MFFTPCSMLPATSREATKFLRDRQRSQLFEKLKRQPANQRRELAALALCLDAVAENTASLRATSRHTRGTRMRTLSDNSTRLIVDHETRFARVFTSFPRSAGDNSDAICRLGACRRAAGDSQSTNRQRLARRPKKQSPTKRDNPRAPAAMVARVGQTTRQIALAHLDHWLLVLDQWSFFAFPDPRIPSPVSSVLPVIFVKTSEKHTEFPTSQPLNPEP